MNNHPLYESNTWVKKQLRTLYWTMLRRFYQYLDSNLLPPYVFYATPKKQFHKDSHLLHHRRVDPPPSAAIPSSAALDTHPASAPLATTQQKDTWIDRFNKAPPRRRQRHRPVNQNMMLVFLGTHRTCDLCRFCHAENAFLLPMNAFFCRLMFLFAN